EIGEKDPHPHPLAPAAHHPGQAVARWHGHRDRDHDDRDDYHEGVQDPAWEVRLSKEQIHVLERGWVIEDPGNVAHVRRAHVQVPVLLERRDEHPVKRESGEHDEPERRRVQRHALHCAPPTSARWASRSIPMATTIRKGSRNTAIAAPCPKSAPRMPPWNASVGKPCGRPAALSVQLITLNVESKIHVHAIAASDTGTAQGRRRTNRAKRLPRNVARNT